MRGVNRLDESRGDTKTLLGPVPRTSDREEPASPRLHGNVASSVPVRSTAYVWTCMRHSPFELVPAGKDGNW